MRAFIQSSLVTLIDNGLSEIMICDFTSHMEVVSFLNLETPHTRFGPFPNLSDP